MISVSPIFLLAFLLSPILLFIYAKRLFAGTSFLSIGQWRQSLVLMWVLNLVCFTALALYFQYRYGYITDDINYFRGAGLFRGKYLWELSDGSEFMYFISAPFKHILGFDRPAFHVFSATLGFIASLTFTRIFLWRTDILLKNSFKFNRLAILSLTCFPNIMLWARVYGKDASMFFLASFLTLSAYLVLKSNKINALNLILIAFLLYLMQILRPHVAGVLGLAFILAYFYKMLQFKTRNAGFGAILKFYVPAILIFIAFIFISSSIRRLGIEKEEFSSEAVKQSIVSAVRMGAYGGSATELASEMKDNPDIIFSPPIVVRNIFNFLFEPLPWHVRGGADFMAFLSNVLLFYLLYKYARRIRLFDEVQIFFFLSTLGLTVLLSFISGNVGLILRQKTIVLPFLFLLLFSRPPEEYKTAAPDEENETP